MRSLAISTFAMLLVACAHGDEFRSTTEPASDFHLDAGVVTLAGDPDASPQTCEQAARARSYIGCDFWPTVVANNVWSVFDYAVIVANTGALDAEVTVSGNGVARSVRVRAGAVSKLYLPWQPELKGPDADACGHATRMEHSVRVRDGAYHLISTRPVSVYQFNALEYIRDSGPEDKDWSSCPGLQACDATGMAVGCLSFSNDASLLLPTTALTGHYRVTGVPGWSHPDSDGGPPVHVVGSYFAITATENDTHVKVHTGARGAILGGDGIPALPAGGSFELTMSAGEVVELVSPASSAADPSGGTVSADQPIQVIAGAPCVPMPNAKGSCDHVEESVIPAEALGKDYVVTAPTAPDGRVAGHVVRLYGNVDDTHLVWAPAPPAGAPSVLQAGEVVDLAIVRDDVRVTGDLPFAVASFMLSGELVEETGLGDPSMSMITAVEQYRRRYVFLAPDDYPASFVDVVLPLGATVSLDGVAQTQTKPLAGTGFAIARLPLDPRQHGAHAIEASAPVGIQVLGYGAYTSYQYPGGLDLKPISDPPVR